MGTLPVLADRLFSRVKKRIVKRSGFNEGCCWQDICGGYRDVCGSERLSSKALITGVEFRIRCLSVSWTAEGLLLKAMLTEIINGGSERTTSFITWKIRILRK